MKRIKKLMAVMTAIASLAVSMCCIPANAAEVSEPAAFETIDTLSASSVHYSAAPYTTTRFFSFTTTGTHVYIYFINANVGPATITLKTASGSYVGEIVIPTNSIPTQLRTFTVSSGAQYDLWVTAGANGADGNLTVNY